MAVLSFPITLARLCAFTAWGSWGLMKPRGSLQGRPYLLGEHHFGEWSHGEAPIVPVQAPVAPQCRRYVGWSSPSQIDTVPAQGQHDCHMFPSASAFAELVSKHLSPVMISRQWQAEYLGRIQSSVRALC